MSDRDDFQIVRKIGDDDEPVNTEPGAHGYIWDGSKQTLTPLKPGMIDWKSMLGVRPYKRR